jgi:hypothetical protein
MIRTCDPLIRSQVLYPTELRVLEMTVGILNADVEIVKHGQLVPGTLRFELCFRSARAPTMIQTVTQQQRIQRLCKKSEMGREARRDTEPGAVVTGCPTIKRPICPLTRSLPLPVLYSPRP